MNPFSATTDALAAQGPESLVELFHENTKLSPYNALKFSQAPHSSEKELWLTSRGFHQYPSAPTVDLADPVPSTEPLQFVMSRRRSGRSLEGPIDLSELSTILIQSLGVTSIVQSVDSSIIQPLRAWPSAGGLYPIETYVIARDVNGVPGGLYHFNVLTQSLGRIISRSISTVLDEGFFSQSFVTSASVVILFVGVFDRTCAKYGDRGYRLVLLDAGHVGQNVLLSCEQIGVSAVAIGGFFDDSLSVDLQLGHSESVVHAIALGRKV